MKYFIELSSLLSYKILYLMNNSNKVSIKIETVSIHKIGIFQLYYDHDP